MPSCQKARTRAGLTPRPYALGPSIESLGSPGWDARWDGCHGQLLEEILNPRGWAGVCIRLGPADSVPYFPLPPCFLEFGAYAKRPVAAPSFYPSLEPGSLGCLSTFSGSVTIHPTSDGSRGCSWVGKPGRPGVGPALAAQVEPEGLGPGHLDSSSSVSDNPLLPCSRLLEYDGTAQNFLSSYVP